MLVEKRQQMILKMLEERKSVTVNEIKDSLGISESTIRRDLTMLDKENKRVWRCYSRKFQLHGERTFSVTKAQGK